MNFFETGYVDQLKHCLKIHLLDGEGSDANAYRAGARTCRADIAAEEEDQDLDEALPPPPGYVPALTDWRRRLGEFRVMAGLAPAPITPVPLGGSFVPGAETGIIPSQIIDPQKQGAGVGIAPDRTFSEPAPGSKRRKAKPVDDAQASLF